MSKEAMQAAALFAVSGPKKKDGKPLPHSYMLCLTWMAYYSRDPEAPYRTRIAQKTLGKLLQLEPRMVRLIIKDLCDAGALTREKEGRENTYSLNIGNADPLSYSAIFAPPEYRQPIAADADEIEVMEYPYQVQYRQSDATNIGNGVPRYRQSDVVSTYKEKKEKEEEKKEEPTPIYDNLARQAEAEYAPSPLPPSPAQAVWRRMQEHLSESMGRSAYETWIRGTTALWTEDGALRIQVRTSHAVDLLSSRYSERIQEAARKVTGSDIEIEIASQGVRA